MPVVDIYAQRGLPHQPHPPIIDMIERGECWEWRGAKSTMGYGVLESAGKQHKVHRVIWEAVVGPIPDGMTIDHLCRNRGCCNPDHLEVVSLVENVMRGESPHAVNARKTHCKNGHPFEGDNLIIDSVGYRQCRICVNRRSLERYHRLKDN